MYLFGVCVHACVCLCVCAFFSRRSSLFRTKNRFAIIYLIQYTWVSHVALGLGVFSGFKLGRLIDWLITPDRPWHVCIYVLRSAFVPHVAIRDRYLKDERRSSRRMIEIEHLQRNSRCELLGRGRAFERRGRITFYVHIRHLCVRIALSMSLSAIINRCSRTVAYNNGVSSFLPPLFSSASSTSSLSSFPRDTFPGCSRNKIATLFDVVDLYVFFLHNLARLYNKHRIIHIVVTARVMYTRIIHIYRTRGKQYAQILPGYVKSNVRERFDVSRNFSI